VYIFAVRVQGFRSITDGWMFPNPHVNVLIGPNNSGKTTLMRACALVLDPMLNPVRDECISEFDFVNGNTNGEICIQVWLKPTLKEPEDLKALLFDKLSKWTVKHTDFGIPCELVPLRIDPTVDEVPEHEELLAIVLRAKWNDDVQAASVEVNIVDEMGRTTPFTHEYRRRLDFRYFPTRRNPIQQLSLTRRSLLSRALDDNELVVGLKALLHTLEEAKAKVTDLPRVKAILQQLDAMTSPQVVQGLSGRMSAGFTLTFLNSNINRLRTALALALSPDPSDADALPLPLEYQGDGVQNLILLMSVCQLLRSQDTQSIVMIEEPEQNLEPALARWIFGELSETEGITNQLFISTLSPALAGEIRGADSLQIVVRKHEEKQTRVVPVKSLPTWVRKQYERNRGRYAAALMARHVLVVEGDSEIGFLPEAFRALSKGKPEANPFYLGLELVHGEGKDEAVKHAKCLSTLFKSTHVLLDYDVPNKKCKKKSDSPTDELMKMAINAGVKPLCWYKGNLLPFAQGTDLEIVLVAQVPPADLFEAIKAAYDDPGHDLTAEAWTRACEIITDLDIRNEVLNIYSGDRDLDEVDLQRFSSIEAQRAFLLALLHGPHSCKSVKDMRIIAEVLASRQALPHAVDVLRDKLVLAIRGIAAGDDSGYLLEAPVATS